MVYKRLDVFRQAVLFETQLPNDRVHISTGIVAKFDLTGLVFANHSANFGSDCARPGRRHEPAGTEYASERSDQAHHIRCRNTNVEVEPSILNTLGQILLTDRISPGHASLLSHVALGEHDYSLRTSDPMRKNDRATNDLVRLLGIDAEMEMNLHGLIKLGSPEPFHDLHCLSQSNRSLRLALGGQCAVTLGLFWHRLTLYLESHTSRRAFDHPPCVFQVAGI